MVNYWSQKGFSTWSVYQPCIRLCRTASCSSQVTSQELFPGGPYRGPFLKQEDDFCTISLLLAPHFQLHHHRLHEFMQLLQSICYISASLCCANRFVWQPSTVDTVSTSGSSPGTCYLVWLALPAGRHGYKAFFGDCQSPYHLDTHITATTGK